MAGLAAILAAVATSSLVFNGAVHAPRARLSLVLSVCLAGLLGLEATASNAIPPDAPSFAFGAKIIDLALSVDAAAHASLVATPDADVPAQMTFKDLSGANVTYDVRIHIKGQLGSRRPLDGKPAFKVKLGKEDRFFGLERLTLNNMVQDPTMVHEALGYQVYEAAGVTVPATGYVQLTVNGQAYGLYLNVETPDVQFLHRRFGAGDGILYEGAYGVDLRIGDLEKFELHEGSDPGRAMLKTFIDALDAPGDDVFYGASPQVDTTSFLAMMAAGALLSDWDNYYASNNYRIYWSPSAARWFFIPTGIDQIFGQTFDRQPTTTVFGASGLLFQKCLASVRCTTDYANTVRGVTDRFEHLGLPAAMDALLAVVDTAAQADPKKRYGAATMAAAQEKMHAFIAARPAEIRAALSCAGDGPPPADGACAGALLVNAAVNQCAQIAAGAAAQNGLAVSVSRCMGGANQRWRLVPRGRPGETGDADNAVALVAVRNGACVDGRPANPRHGRSLQTGTCSGVDSQTFLVRTLEQGVQLVARPSGKCIAVPPGNPRGAALIQVTCSEDEAQVWHVERSLYK